MSGGISIKLALKWATLGVAALSLGACTQATKHSNTLIFAVNTTSGLKVGADEKQIPGIQIGHSRQELAFVPVVSNTGESSGGGDLTPCPDANIEKCKLVGTHDGTNKDSYSTIASFGSKKGATVDNTGKVTGEVAIAQYFATGIAAQYLAVTGGANIVSAGGDTKAKAEAAASAANAIAEKEKANAKRYVTTIDTGRVIAKAMLGDASDPVDATKRKALATKIGVGACDDTQLGKFDQRSVKQFLDEMQAQKFQCLVRLANNSAK